MVRHITTAVLCMSTAALIGCSGFDSTIISMHPDTAAAGSTFDVAIVNTFNYFDSTGSVSSEIKRDSLHVLAGLPASWNILGAKCAVINDLTKSQMLAWLNEDVGQQEIVALLQKYQTTASAMTTDAPLSASVNNRTFIAHDGSGDTELEVTAGSAGQWKGFSAPVNIVLQKGRKVDTVLSFDSIMGLAGESDSALDPATLAMLQMLGYTIPDSVGVCSVPVAIFLSVQAGPKTGDDTLFYFTKTGTMKKAPASAGSLMPDLDTGDMVFKPITLTSAQAVQRARTHFDSRDIGVFADCRSGTVRIDLGKDRRTTSIGIYSLRGNLVKKLTPAASEQTVTWNGTDNSGCRAGPGSYLVKITGTGGSVTRSVQLMR